MKLNEYQRNALGSAILNYILYVVSYHGKTPESDTKMSLQNMADKNLYFTVSMLLGTGKPEKKILDNLDNEIWGPEDVIKYVEEKY